MVKNDARKATNPLEHTARLLDLVPYINTHQGISLVDLAEVFEVSPDQMASDLSAPVTVIKEAGHCPNEDQPEATAKAIADFWSSL